METGGLEITDEMVRTTVRSIDTAARGHLINVLDVLALCYPDLGVGARKAVLRKVLADHFDETQQFAKYRFRGQRAKAICCSLAVLLKLITKLPGPGAELMLQFGLQPLARAFGGDLTLARGMEAAARRLANALEQPRVNKREEEEEEGAAGAGIQVASLPDLPLTPTADFSGSVFGHSASFLALHSPGAEEGGGGHGSGGGNASDNDDDDADDRALQRAWNRAEVERRLIANARELQDHARRQVELIDVVTRLDERLHATLDARWYKSIKCYLDNVVIPPPISAAPSLPLKKATDKQRRRLIQCQGFLFATRADMAEFERLATLGVRRDVAAASVGALLE